jgi:hypothetical protein
LQQLQVNSCLQTCDLSSSWGVISGHFVHLQFLEAGSKWGPDIMHCCANAVVLLLTFCCSVIWNFLSQDSNSGHHHISCSVGLCNSEVHEEVSCLHLTGQICYTLVMKENATCIFT